MRLFEAHLDDRHQPLAERLRPRTAQDVIGQSHLLEPGGLLARLLAAEELPSMILWGPPGVGKTTLARLLATNARAAFEALSAVQAGISDLKVLLERASERLNFHNQTTVLFLDEIHRFNKTQQDFLLPHVESGRLVLLGATTENPGFAVIPALRSRCISVALQGLDEDDLKSVISRGLDCLKAQAEEPAIELLVRWSQGDARRSLNLLEWSHKLAHGEVITAELVATAADRPAVLADRNGDHHYDTMSALIKSMRASDANAALHYLARMLEAGEDITFIARRLVIFASEDIGNAAPMALVVSQSAADAVRFIGLPEAALTLSQAVTFLADAPKSRACTEAIRAARADLQDGAWPEIPARLLNRKRPHDVSMGQQESGPLLPKALADRCYYPKRE